MFIKKKKEIERYLIKIQLMKLNNNEINWNERGINQNYLTLQRLFRKKQYQNELEYDNELKAYIGFTRQEKDEDFFFIDPWIKTPKEKEGVPPKNKSFDKSGIVEKINKILNPEVPKENKKKKTKVLPKVIYDSIMIYVVYLKGNSQIQFLIDYQTQ